MAFLITSLWEGGTDLSLTVSAIDGSPGLLSLAGQTRASSCLTGSKRSASVCPGTRIGRGSWCGWFSSVQLVFRCYPVCQEGIIGRWGPSQACLQKAVAGVSLLVPALTERTDVALDLVSGDLGIQVVAEVGLVNKDKVQSVLTNFGTLVVRPDQCQNIGIKP